MTMFNLLLLLWGLHFVCDFPLQSDAIAVGKGKFDTPHLGVPWYYWLTAHAATHAVAVGLATGSAALGACEFIAHFIIDVLKCRKLTNIHVDQALHLLCKIAWVWIWVATAAQFGAA